MKFILGKKIGMTQVFVPSGEVVPVTRIQAGPCQVVQVKNGDKDNNKAVQLGFGERKEFRNEAGINGLKIRQKILISVRWLTLTDKDENSRNINKEIIMEEKKEPLINSAMSSLRLIDIHKFLLI